MLKLRKETPLDRFGHDIKEIWKKGNRIKEIELFLMELGLAEECQETLFIYDKEVNPYLFSPEALDKIEEVGSRVNIYYHIGDIVYLDDNGKNRLFDLEKIHSINLAGISIPDDFLYPRGEVMLNPNISRVRLLRKRGFMHIEYGEHACLREIKNVEFIYNGVIIPQQWYEGFFQPSSLVQLDYNKVKPFPKEFLEFQEENFKIYKE